MGKDSMQVEYADAIANPNPERAHQIEGITPVSYQYSFASNADEDTLTRVDCTHVVEPREQELFSWAGRAREITRWKASEHLVALPD